MIGARNDEREFAIARGAVLALQREGKSSAAIRECLVLFGADDEMTKSTWWPQVEHLIDHPEPPPPGPDRPAEPQDRTPPEPPAEPIAPEPAPAAETEAPIAPEPEPTKAALEPAEKRKLRLAQARRLLRYRLMVTLPDNPAGHSVMDLLLCLGMKTKEAVRWASWTFPDGYIDHVRQYLPCSTSAEECGRRLGLLWDERIQPGVRAYQIVPIDYDPAVHAAWLKERKRVRDSKRKRRLPPKPKTAIVDQLAPRELAILRVVDREWMAIMAIVEQLQTAREFRKSLRSKLPSVKTMRQAVLRGVLELVRVKLFELKEERLPGSVGRWYVRVVSPSLAASNDPPPPVKFRRF
jgi:hypothetical protein